MWLSCATGQLEAQTYTVGLDQAQYTVVEGGSVDVVVVLTEEIAAGQTARLAPGNNDGLFAFGTGLDFSSFTGAANGSTFNSLVLDPLFTGGSANSGEDVTVGPGVVSFEGTEDFTNDADGEPGVTGTMVSATVWELSLATLTFDAGDLNSLTTLQLQDHVAPDASPFIFANGAGAGVTPPVAFSSSTILVVPEPAAASLIFLGLGAGLFRRKRDR